MSAQMKHQSMNKQTLEESLKVVLTHRPDPAFVDRLERRLLTQSRSADANVPRHRGSIVDRWHELWKTLTRPVPALRWMVVPLVVLVFLLAGLLMIGPERVLAQLQSWLSYVPNVGFVELEAARVLSAPQEITQDGIAVRVERVVATPEETIVVVRSEGLPAEDQFGPEGADRKSPLPRLQLPDGTMLAPQAWTLRVGEAALIFPPLPPTIDEVHLYMAQLPLVPADIAPGGWLIPLTLEPVTPEQLADTMAATASLLPGGYVPPNASETHHGVTVDVLGVAHTAEETVLHLNVAWEDVALAFTFPPMVALADQQGNVYEVQWNEETDPDSRINSAVFAPRPRDPSELSREELVSVAPLLPSAEQLTLTIGELWFQVESEGNFVVDLGAEPQIGDSWELDIVLNVAGVPVYITRAELVDEAAYASLGESASAGQTTLVFHWTANPSNGRNVTTLGLGGRQTFQKGFDGGSGGSNWTALRWGDEETLPTGEIEIEVRDASIVVGGPWEIKWSLP